MLEGNQNIDAFSFFIDGKKFYLKSDNIENLKDNVCFVQDYYVKVFESYSGLLSRDEVFMIIILGLLEKGKKENNNYSQELLLYAEQIESKLAYFKDSLK